MSQFKRFDYDLMIKEHHLDTFGHVNNATYLELFEEARWDFLNTIDFGLEVIQQRQVGPVVLECNVKFIRELRVREVIQIQSQLHAYDRKIAVMDQVIMNSSQKVCAEARFTFGFFDMKARRLILPPEEWMSAVKE